MCKEIIKLKEEHNYDFSNYFDLNRIDDDAENLVNEFMQNPDYGLKSDEIKVPVLEIAKKMGFNVYTAEYNDRDLSGTIGISENLREKYGSSRVIILNNQDSDEHILFTLCHELAHYIYDYQCNINQEYSNTYRTGEPKNNQEIRANRFAAAFLMPKKSFIDSYKSFSKDTDDQNAVVRLLSKKFSAPETAVRMRIAELLNGW